MGFFSGISKAFSSVSKAISPWAPIIGAGVSYLGSQRQNTANRQNAAQQMAFQSSMSNSAYQRSMADMRKAGLNPILAYKMGGASTPGGAMPQAVNELEPAVSSAMGLRRLQEDLKNIKSDTKLKDMQQNTQDAMAHQATHLGAKAKAETDAIQMNNSVLRLQKKLIEDALKTDAGKGLELLKHFNPLINSAKGLTR